MVKKQVKFLKLYKNNITILIVGLISFISSLVLRHYNAPWFITIFILAGLFCFLFYIEYNNLLNSWKSNIIEIAINYVTVMLVLAMIFVLLFLMLTGSNQGYFYPCENSSIKIMNPGYYYSLSNIFSLSYTEPLCAQGAILKFIIGFEAVLGNVITLIILAVIIAFWIDNRNRKK